MNAETPVTRWRISSHSAQNGTCVEVGELADGCVAVRNSNHPDAGTLVVTRAQFTVPLRAVKAGALR